MSYLGIDQHSRPLTVSLRDEDGDVVQARQASTQPEKINAFFTESHSRSDFATARRFVAVRGSLWLQ